MKYYPGTLEGLCKKDHKGKLEEKLMRQTLILSGYGTKNLECFIDQLVVGLGFRFSISCFSFNLVRGFNLFEQFDRVLAVKFFDLPGALSRWLLVYTHATPYLNEKEKFLVVLLWPNCLLQWRFDGNW